MKNFKKLLHCLHLGATNSLHSDGGISSLLLLMPTLLFAILFSPLTYHLLSSLVFVFVSVCYKTSVNVAHSFLFMQ